jgi:hypothetical protein
MFQIFVTPITIKLQLLRKIKTPLWRPPSGHAYFHIFTKPKKQRKLRKLNPIKKKKRIPSIFNDESTGSCICLSSLIYMSHVNKVQPIRVKNDTHSSNTTCFVTGSMVLYRITPQSCIDHDLVSVVKILLKAFFLFIVWHHELGMVSADELGTVSKVVRNIPQRKDINMSKARYGKKSVVAAWILWCRIMKCIMVPDNKMYYGAG